MITKEKKKLERKINAAAGTTKAHFSPVIYTHKCIMHIRANSFVKQLRILWWMEFVWFSKFVGEFEHEAQTPKII